MAGFRLQADTSSSAITRIVRQVCRPLVGMPVLLALGLGTLPARALPAASVQLFRINGNGVKPMPAISDALDRARLQGNSLAQAAKSPVLLVAQSSGAPVAPVTPATPLGTAVAPVAAAPVAAAGISPLLILGAVVLVGVGVAAAAGAFSSDGGGGGTNTSSQ